MTGITKDEVIRMAGEAGFIIRDGYIYGPSGDSYAECSQEVSVLFNAIMERAAEEVEQRVAHLEKDAVRLDWLESRKESHGFCHTGYGEYRHYAYQESGFKTVREVIDTAMEASNAKAD